VPHLNVETVARWRRLGAGVDLEVLRQHLSGITDGVKQGRVGQVCRQDAAREQHSRSLGPARPRLTAAVPGRLAAPALCSG
jgi:hypothetical protein